MASCWSALLELVIPVLSPAPARTSSQIILIFATAVRGTSTASLHCTLQRGLAVRGEGDAVHTHTPALRGPTSLHVAASRNSQAPSARTPSLTITQSHLCSDDQLHVLAAGLLALIARHRSACRPVPPAGDWVAEERVPAISALR
ncbi:hypothetical protein C8R44DRAFT_857354 [Mycena epipterygia]|nr:hypothetical protein C8R44DRAFT_857354 [Mycena epipterygia]